MEENIANSGDSTLNKDTANYSERAYRLMFTARSMALLYEKKMKMVSKYVHATSMGHEAVQVACGLLMRPDDFAYPYYRDDAMMLAFGLTPYDMMLQLMAKRDDPFSGGRTYYCHPSLREVDKVKIPHQSSATGMQAIPAAGCAMGLKYKEVHGMVTGMERPLVVCSLGDAAVTEGEVSEAFQMAALKQLPIIFLVQDNGWDISAYKTETMTWNAAEYVQGIKGMRSVSIDGTDFEQCYQTLEEVFRQVRDERCPFVVHAEVPLLNHHTSGVRKEWYRPDLEEAFSRDPLPRFRKWLIETGILSEEILENMESEVQQLVGIDFDRAWQAEDPRPEDLFTHMFAPTPITAETGKRVGDNDEPKNMVDCGIFAIRELMAAHPECLLYGQDVGRRLGGVFREAATLAEQFGDHRVFNTPIQEAFIVGSTAGMSAVGLKPIVEVQFADYIWPGLNQLFTEVSRSCYLSNGKWPVSMVLRVPIGAYGHGGPYHSSSVESVVTNIRGIKIAYPSNAADFKGLLKAAYYDLNPVVIFEHKGLYWAKLEGTEEAKSIEPAADYILPLGKGNLILQAEKTDTPQLAVITYGMGVHWAKNAAASFPGQISIVDLRSLYPLDEELIYSTVREANRCLVITEESVNGSFAQSLAARIQEHCFTSLDAPVRTVGAENLPAIPLNETLEKTMLPSIEKVRVALQQMLEY